MAKRYKPRGGAKEPEEIIASLPGSAAPPSLYRRLRVSEIGATRSGVHTTCSVCGNREPVDDKAVRESILNRAHDNLHVKAAGRFQTWFTEAWGWKTWKREEAGNLRLRSNYIAQVFLTGAGRYLRLCFRRARRKLGGKPWFAIGMHGDPSLGEHLFSCPLSGLAEVVAGIAAEAPDFKRQLIAKLALSPGPAISPVHDERPTEGNDDAKPVIIDDASAVFLE